MSFLSKLPQTLQTVDPIVYFVMGGALVLGILVICILYLDHRIRKLLGNSSAKTIEDALVRMRQDIGELKNFKDESVRYLRVMEERVKRSTQAIETVRFSPFKGSGDGGNQSFSTTILNENGDGVIISSLYSRERVSIFSKPVKGFNPEFELSEEERGTLARAKESLTTLATKKI